MIQKLKLCDVCIINMGQSPDSSTYNDEREGLPFFQGNADFGEKSPRPRVWCSSPIKIAEKGDILISVRAPIGAMNIADEKSCIGRGLAAIRVKNNEVCDSDYLFYCLESKISFLQSMGTGSTFKAINKNVLNELTVILPEIEKQQSIALILTRIKNSIRLKKQQLNEYDNLVKSQFIEMFGDPKYNSKNLPIIQLGDLCRVGSSKRIYQDEQTDSGVPFLRISDLNNRIDGGDLSCDLYISAQTFESLKSDGLVPSAGDILVTARGTLGRCYIVKNSDRFYFQDGMITWLSKLSDEVTSLYISHLFETDGIREQIASLQAGSTVAYLSIAMTKKLKVMIPPIELQNQFARFVEQTDKSKFRIKQSLEKLETCYKALLQKYFG